MTARKSTAALPLEVEPANRNRSNVPALIEVPRAASEPPKVQPDPGSIDSPEGKEWSWTDPELAADIVFPTSRAVATYRNPAGDLVIRQQAGPLDEDDSIIVVPWCQAENFYLSVKHLVED